MTLNSDFRSVKCPKLEHEKLGSEGGVMCQNEKMITNVDAIRNEKMLCFEFAIQN